MKVLITGGGGMIGQAIAKEHIANGDDVFIYDKWANDFHSYKNLLGVSVTLTQVQHMIKNNEIDLLSHQAGLVGVGQSQYEVDKYIHYNVGFTGYLIQLLIDSKYKGAITFAGSMSVYGEGEYHCAECCDTFIGDRKGKINVKCPSCGNEQIYFYSSTEMSPTSPVSIYGVTKLSQEMFLKTYADIYNIPFLSLRYFSVYDPEGSPLNPYTGVLSVIANKILNSDTIEINEDGEQTRDLISKVDVAKIHCELSSELARDHSFHGCSILNVGTGTKVSLKDVVETMCEHLGWKGEVFYNGKVRKGDIKNSQADLSQLYEYLKPTTFNGIKPIAVGIEEYCNFIDTNRDEFTVKQDTCKEADEELKKRGLL